jgi:hypothetical protein
MNIPMGRECFEAHPFREDLTTDPLPPPNGWAFYRVKGQPTILVEPVWHQITGRFVWWNAFEVDLTE